MSYLPKFSLQRFAASGAVSAVPCNVEGILLMGGSATTTLKLTNDADGSGTAVLNVSVPATQSIFLDLSTLNGVMFSSKCYATLAGTGGEAYIWTE